MTFTITIAPVITTSGTPDELWLSQTYRTVLHREIQPTEVSYWMNLLGSGTTRERVAQQILSSPEYHGDYIQNLFQNYLGIPADQAALTFYQSLYQLGWTDEQVKAEILASAAFFNLSGSTNEGFLNEVYQDVLGFPVDNVGRAFWLPQLEASGSRFEVALCILSSPGAEEVVVQYGYSQLLNRNGNDGLAYWTNFLQTAVSTRVSTPACCRPRNTA